MDSVSLTIIAVLSATMFFTVALNLVIDIRKLLLANPLDMNAIATAEQYSLARPSTIMELPEAAAYYARTLKTLVIVSLFAISVLSSIYVVWWVGIVHFLAVLLVARFMGIIFFSGGALGGFIHLLSWVLAPGFLVASWYFAYKILIAPSHAIF